MHDFRLHSVVHRRGVRRGLARRDDPLPQDGLSLGVRDGKPPPDRQGPPLPAPEGSRAVPRQRPGDPAHARQPDRQAAGIATAINASTPFRPRLVGASNLVLVRGTSYEVLRTRYFVRGTSVVAETASYARPSGSGYAVRSTCYCSCSYCHIVCPASYCMYPPPSHSHIAHVPSARSLRNPPPRRLQAVR